MPVGALIGASGGSGGNDCPTVASEGEGGDCRGADGNGDGGDGDGGATRRQRVRRWVRSVTTGVLTGAG